MGAHCVSITPGGSNARAITKPGKRDEAVKGFQKVLKQNATASRQDHTVTLYKLLRKLDFVRSFALFFCSFFQKDFWSARSR